jgi:hypothetical protein
MPNILPLNNSRIFIRVKAESFDMAVSIIVSALVPALYRIIKNNCRGFNNLSYTISLKYFYLIEQHSKFWLHTLLMLYMWFYKHQRDNRVRSTLFVAYQRWWFQWRFWFVLSVPGYLLEEEEHKPNPWHNPIDRNHIGLYLEKEVARRVASIIIGLTAEPSMR